MARRTYHIAYRLYKNGDVEHIDVVSGHRGDAYIDACFEAIPQKDGKVPYSAWVESVTYANGNCHRFNTSEGNAW